MILDEVIYDILHTDAQDTTSGRLGDLLGYNATTKPRCVFLEYPPERVDTPIITLAIIADAGRFPRDRFYGITVWGGEHDTILHRVWELLHKKTELTATDFSIKAILFDNCGSELYDEDLKVYYKQARYRAILVKT